MGAVYNLVLLVAAGIMVTANPLYPDRSITVSDYLPYAILAFVTMLYPLSGFSLLWATKGGCDKFKLHTCFYATNLLC